MSNIAIKVEDLGKLYRLGEVGTGTISHDLNRFLARIRGKEDPFSKIGETNDRTQKGTSDYVWSLKDVNFEIKQGDAVGIIGRNGAGKSTLLKLLSKVTKPSNGKIYTRGRIASLLEVGTGFHPEMTGRENIFLNGAIMGMTRKEITRKFDEIVDFSGVERYVDTPVKRYSSGMYVRLAFAVAAHLESEILIVDEVLAVGDAEFQKKCLGKMNDVSKGEGRTVLFVSHNMGSILQLCNQCFMLENGRLKIEGSPKVIVDEYYKSNESNSVYIDNKNLQKEILFKRIETVDEKGMLSSTFAHSSKITVKFTIEINSFERIHNIGIVLLTRDGRKVFTVNKPIYELVENEKTGIKSFEFAIPNNLIAPNDYSFIFALNTKSGSITYDWIEDACPIKIYDDGTDLAFAEGIDYGCIILKEEWNKH